MFWPIVLHIFLESASGWAALMGELATVEDLDSLR